MLRTPLLVLLLGTWYLIAGSGSLAEEPKAAVSLILAKASAERSGGDVRFRCEVQMDNATGKDLTARSNFSSVLFDGLELVVTDKAGKVLVQQPYTGHQSPFAPPGKTATLKRGTTTETLGFPVRDLAGDAKVVKVRLVGTLPGSDYKHILSTETLEFRIKD